jgi:hypothetical protein
MIKIICPLLVNWLKFKDAAKKPIEEDKPPSDERLNRHDRMFEMGGFPGEEMMFNHQRHFLEMVVPMGFGRPESLMRMRRQQQEVDYGSEGQRLGGWK